MDTNQPTPLESLEEMISHPADITLETIQNEILLKRQELFNARKSLLDLPTDEKELEKIKTTIRQKHDEFMDLLKKEALQTQTTNN